MARFRDFGSTTKNYEPLSFKLNGQEFQAVPAIPGKVLLDFAKESSSGDVGMQAELINKFFSKILVEESYERFNTLIESTDQIVEVETLAAIVGWLMEEYTNRPEGQPGA